MRVQQFILHYRSKKREEGGEKREEGREKKEERRGTKV